MLECYFVANPPKGDASFEALRQRVDEGIKLLRMTTGCMATRQLAWSGQVQNQDNPFLFAVVEGSMNLGIIETQWTTLLMRFYAPVYPGSAQTAGWHHERNMDSYYMIRQVLPPGMGF
jgi:hypothetical protein